MCVMVWRPRRGKHRALRRKLDPWRRRVLREMVADAIDFRLAQLELPCPDCDRAEGLICARHAAVFAEIEAYRQLAQDLGVDLLTRCRSRRLSHLAEARQLATPCSLALSVDGLGRNRRTRVGRGPDSLPSRAPPIDGVISRWSAVSARCRARA